MERENCYFLIFTAEGLIPSKGLSHETWRKFKIAEKFASAPSISGSLYTGQDVSLLLFTFFVILISKYFNCTVLLQLLKCEDENLYLLIRKR